MAQKHYIYIFIKEITGPLNIGFSKNILEAIAFHQKIPAVVPSRLIYMEIADNLEAANLRFEEIYKLSREEKLELIKNQNPDLITLLPGDNIEL